MGAHNNFPRTKHKTQYTNTIKIKAQTQFQVTFQQKGNCTKYSLQTLTNFKTVQAQDALYAHSKLHKRPQCVLTIADTFTPPISNLHACKTAEKACPLLLHLYASWLCENVVPDDWQLEGLRVCLGCIQNVPCPLDEKAKSVPKMYPMNTQSEKVKSVDL